MRTLVLILIYSFFASFQKEVSGTLNVEEFFSNFNLINVTKFFDENPNLFLLGLVHNPELKSLDTCLKYCFFYRGCRHVNFNHFSKTCFFESKPLLSGRSQIIENDRTSLYSLDILNLIKPKGLYRQEDITWYESSGYFVEGLTEVKPLSLEHCQFLCLHTHNCRSINWNTINQKCYIQKEKIEGIISKMIKKEDFSNFFFDFNSIFKKDLYPNAQIVGQKNIYFDKKDSSTEENFKSILVYKKYENIFLLGLKIKNSITTEKGCLEFCFHSPGCRIANFDPFLKTCYNEEDSVVLKKNNIKDTPSYTLYIFDLQISIQFEKYFVSVYNKNNFWIPLNFKSNGLPINKTNFVFECKNICSGTFDCNSVNWFNLITQKCQIQEKDLSNLNPSKDLINPWDINISSKKIMKPRFYTLKMKWLEIYEDFNIFGLTYVSHPKSLDYCLKSCVFYSQCRVANFINSSKSCYLNLDGNFSFIQNESKRVVNSNIYLLDLYETISPDYTVLINKNKIIWFEFKNHNSLGLSSVEADTLEKCKDFCLKNLNCRKINWYIHSKSKCWIQNDSKVEFPEIKTTEDCIEYIWDYEISKKKEITEGLKFQYIEWLRFENIRSNDLFFEWKPKTINNCLKACLNFPQCQIISFDKIKKECFIDKKGLEIKDIRWTQNVDFITYSKIQMI